MKKDIIDKYIELMYSETSDLNKIEDVGERKKAAAKGAGLDITDKETLDIMHLQNEKANNRIFNYLSKTQSNNYIALTSDQQLFWEIQFRKMSPLDTTDDEVMLKNINLKTTMSIKSQELLERIDALYRRIYKHEPEMKMAQKQVRMLSPEQRIVRKTS